MMRTVFEQTPLQRNEHLSKKYKANIFLKREDLTPVRSYKLRGALNSMQKCSDINHFVCASAGNHAQGVAYMASHLNVQATIFMPSTTLQNFKNKIFGGDNVETRTVGDYFDSVFSRLPSSAKESTLLSFDDPDIIEGQGTVAAEIESQLGFVPDKSDASWWRGFISGSNLFFCKNCEYFLTEQLALQVLAALEPTDVLTPSIILHGASVKDWQSQLRNSKKC